MIGEVTDVTFLERLVSETTSKFGKLDILVLNHGMGSVEGKSTCSLDDSVADYDRIIDVNVRR